MYTGLCFWQVWLPSFIVIQSCFEYRCICYQIEDIIGVVRSIVCASTAVRKHSSFNVSASVKNNLEPSTTYPSMVRNCPTSGLKKSVGFFFHLSVILSVQPTVLFIALGSEKIFRKMKLEFYQNRFRKMITEYYKSHQPTPRENCARLKPTGAHFLVEVSVHIDQVKRLSTNGVLPRADADSAYFLGLFEMHPAATLAPTGMISPD